MRYLSALGIVFSGVLFVVGCVWGWMALLLLLAFVISEWLLLFFCICSSLFIDLILVFMWLVFFGFFVLFVGLCLSCETFCLFGKWSF